MPYDSNKEVYYKTYKIIQNEQTVLDIKIEVKSKDTYDAYKWDSRNGLVLAKLSNTETWVSIPFITEKGAIGAIPPSAFTTENILSMEYDYWYC